VRGKFITLEGVEGVGKSTNLATIEKVLQSLNVDYIKSREPGGSSIAERIRALLLDPEAEPMSELAELLLVFAARAEHLEKVIRPSLENGVWVLCDRFTDATFAYQGGGRGLSTAIIDQLQALVQGDLRPDLTVILDLDPAIGLERARERGALDRFEKEEQLFFNRVREAYLAIAAAEPKRCMVIDASKPLEQVGHDLVAALNERIESLNAEKGVE
jgi:dTMP kinase